MKYWHGNTLTTEPATEPITKAETKLWLKIDDDITDDDIIDSLIESARKLAEDYCNRAFIDQSWTLSLDCMPEEIYLPKGYLDSVTSVNVYSDAGVASLQDSTYYQVVTGENGMLFLESGYSWDTTTRPEDQMRIIYKVGYGDATTDIPEGLKTAIKQLVAYLYENRETTELPGLIKSLLNPYKIYNI